MAESLEYIKKQCATSPSIGIVLGSGLSDCITNLEQSVVIPYNAIPHFPVSTVSGHKGQMVIGKLKENPIVILQGRFHFYEGYPIEMITYPIKILKELGVNKLILTNAAGGINRTFSVGDFMLITDHIQFIHDKRAGLFQHQLTFKPNRIYSKRLNHIAMYVANQLNIPLKQGVYAAVPGPSYETPAEINMLDKLGADAVGMSTAPEAQFAYANNMEVAAISFITNIAAGLSNQTLSHEEVIEATEKNKQKFALFITNFIEEISKKGERCEPVTG